MVLRRWEVQQDNLVSSTGLIMWIGHRKEIRKLTFRALALRRSDSHIINPVIGQNRHLSVGNAAGIPICELLCAIVSKRGFVQNFHMKTSLMYLKMNMLAEHISIWMVSHKNSFWHRGKSQLEIDLFWFRNWLVEASKTLADQPGLVVLFNTCFQVQPCF